MRATVVRAGVVLVVLSVSGCSGLFSTYDGPELVSNVSAGATQTTGGAALPTYGSFYAGDLCLSEEGEVTVSDVELIDPFGDAEVSGFSTFAFRSGTLGLEPVLCDDFEDDGCETG